MIKLTLIKQCPLNYPKPVKEFTDNIKLLEKVGMTEFIKIKDNDKRI